MRIVDPQVAIAMLHRETPTQVQPFHQMAYPPPAGPSNFGAPPMSMPHNIGVPPTGAASYPQQPYSGQVSCILRSIL